MTIVRASANEQSLFRKIISMARKQENICHGSKSVPSKMLRECAKGEIFRETMFATIFRPLWSVTCFAFGVRHSNGNRSVMTRS